MKLKIEKARDGKPFEVEVDDANIIGPYAVHPFYIYGGKETRGWTATHILSGGCIGELKTEAIAKKLAKKLIPITRETTDMAEVFTDKQAAMDIIILDRRRAMSWLV